MMNPDAMAPIVEAKILIVDDEPTNVELLQGLLRRGGATKLRSVTDSTRAVEAFIAFEPDLVLLDLHMPNLDGFSVMERMNFLIPADVFLPIVVLTADISTDAKARALSNGAKDFLTKPFDVTEVLLRVNNLLETRGLHLRLQDQLRHAQKMEVVGRLTAGIAHDFNNLLSVILNYGSFIQDDLPDGMPVQDDLKQIRQAAERATRLVRQLLQFSRSEVVRSRIFNPVEVIETSRGLFEQLVGEGVEIRLPHATAVSNVQIDPGHFEQVLMNLIVNARDAMPEGGTIDVWTRNVTIREHDAHLIPNLPWGEYVSLSVADTGIGLPEGIRDQIFRPFFTTKSADRGTGLGLSTVNTIVREAGGAIDVVSEAGKGTTFEIFLPAASGKTAERDLEVLPPADVQGHGERILIAEDEDVVRQLLLKVLTGVGYEVFAAGSGKEALEILQAGHRFELLITDVVMPSMSGKRLSLATGLKTLFLSGYTDEVLAEHGVERASDDLVMKPFEANELLHKTRQLLSRSEETCVT